MYGQRFSHFYFAFFCVFSILPLVMLIFRVENYISEFCSAFKLMCVFIYFDINVKTNFAKDFHFCPVKFKFNVIVFQTLNAIKVKLCSPKHLLDIFNWEIFHRSYRFKSYKVLVSLEVPDFWRRFNLYNKLKLFYSLLLE